MGILTVSGALIAKHGLSAAAPSAYASVPTGLPRSPIPSGMTRFTQPLPRPRVAERLPLKPTSVINPMTGTSETNYAWMDPENPGLDTGLLPSRRSSYHTLYNYHRERGDSRAEAFTNPVTRVGPVEGRPPMHRDGNDYFAHQRWAEFAPKVGYVLSIGQAKAGQRIHPSYAAALPDAFWTFGPRYNRSLISTPRPAGRRASGRFEGQGYFGVQSGELAPTLIQARYGEPLIARIHNDLPVDRDLNGGFGRNEMSTHLHNGHNGAESDGASNAFHFPGTFYDYHWKASLARHDMSQPGKAQLMDPQFKPGDPRCASIDDNGRPVPIPGDFREIQSSLWFHDHRFFFTAENVNKGVAALYNMYSAVDSGNEAARHPGALGLPSGTAKPWGNLDYDINLVLGNYAFDQNQQHVFDSIDTDGFLGDIVTVNNAFAPYLEVKARRYRFRILNGCVSRFFQLAFVDQDRKPVPVWVIANDGNLLPRPVYFRNGVIDPLSTAERFDVIIDFKELKAAGVRNVTVLNLIYHDDGRKPEGRVSISKAFDGLPIDPGVGPLLRFDIGADALDESLPMTATRALTEQIPVVAPVRTRTFTYTRQNGDSRNTPDGQCIPDCGEYEKFKWSIQVNGQAWHSLNATRISALIPKPGEVEHWNITADGGGWAHPIHLHFEEGLTIKRSRNKLQPTEVGARKDVWNLENDTVTIQVRFGEFGGAYVQHCHNTTHEDFAMLMRFQVLRDETEAKLVGDAQWVITPTPIPTPRGVDWKLSEVIPEGQPSFPASKPVR
jgi:FtsP/CotA-like multicopper oxidase with cupredoxin domain